MNTATAITVRPMTEHDVPACCGMLIKLRYETVWGTIAGASDVPHLATTLLKAMMEPESQKVLVAQEDEFLVGLCYGEIVTHKLMPHVPYLMEWALYVEPYLRGHGAGRQLWREMILWAKDHGAVGAAYGKPHVGSSHGRVEDIHWTYWGAEPCLIS